MKCSAFTTTNYAGEEGEELGQDVVEVADSGAHAALVRAGLVSPAELGVQRRDQGTAITPQGAGAAAATAGSPAPTPAPAAAGGVGLSTATAVTPAAQLRAPPDGAAVPDKERVMDPELDQPPGDKVSAADLYKQAMLVARRVNPYFQQQSSGLDKRFFLSNGDAVVAQALGDPAEWDQVKHKGWGGRGRGVKGAACPVTSLGRGDALRRLCTSQGIL